VREYGAPGSVKMRVVTRVLTAILLHAVLVRSRLAVELRTSKALAILITVTNSVASRGPLVRPLGSDDVVRVEDEGRLPSTFARKLPVRSRPNPAVSRMTGFRAPNSKVDRQKTTLSQVFVGRDGGKRHSDPVSATDAYWE
jgi:hypothetical protein